ncbi:MAG: hypothetical protein D6683_16035 [Actinomyces sp.]|nr:MAG: hypothetical protein D6683_16035 [Actinomyces sp.]
MWPPAPFVGALEALPRVDDRRIRWTGRDQWHVTLRYLGDVDPEPVATALAGIRLPPADIVFGPRVVRWGVALAVIPVEGLDTLAAAVRTATAGIVPPDERPFRGHLTVARARGRARLPLAAVGASVAGSARVDEFALVASDLTPDGARYRTLERWRLG